MKKIINFLKLKFTYNISFVLFAFVASYNFILFIALTINNSNFNYYDVILNQLNYLNIFLFLSLFFLFFLYKLYENSNFEQYILLKFKSKHQVYNLNILTIVISSIIFLSFIHLIAFTESIYSVSFNNQWSPYFFKTMTGTLNIFFTQENLLLLTDKIDPLLYTFIINLLVFLYFCTVGIIFSVFNILFNNRSISFIMTIIIILLNLALDSAGNFIKKFTFTYNIFFITGYTDKSSILTFITYRFIYWFILLFILFVLGKYLIQKKDLTLGSN